MNTNEYEVVARNGDLPKCDRCGYEHVELETAETNNTIEVDGQSEIERVCRYCYETELGNITGHVHASRIDAQTHALARGIVHAFNALELRLTKGDAEPPVVSIVIPYQSPDRRLKLSKRRTRVMLGGKFRGDAERRKGLPDRRKD